MNATEEIINSLSLEKRKILEKIDPNFWKANSWYSKYLLAKRYYEYYKNIKIPVSFKTKDGINYDKDGISLGKWISSQKSRINKLSDYKRELLSKINISPKRYKVKISNSKRWKNNYVLSKKYYNLKGNLDMPLNYVTEDGVRLGLWLYSQKEGYRGVHSSISMDRIKMLEKIGIKWFSENRDLVLQEEEINSNNYRRKEIEILNRFKSLLLTYDMNDSINTKKINNDFVKKLGIRK